MSVGDLRATPEQLFAALHREFGFTVDVAASAENAKLPRFITREQDGLVVSWKGERAFCNPPFSNIAPWVIKAWSAGAELVVMLLPANRTEQGWWQDLVEPFRDQPGSPLTTRFIRGRPKFIPAGSPQSAPNHPKFGCVLLVWRQVGPSVGCTR